MQYARIRVERVRATEKIVLSNPKRRNALGPQTVGELLHALEAARTDDGVRVIIVTGEGKTFCSGGDFAQMGMVESLRAPPPGSPLPAGDVADLLLAVLRCDKPTIARVNGHALGTGLALVAACTFSVALQDATFGTPEIDAGLFPMIAMPLLARVAQRRRLLEMMILGERIDAAEAARIGLVGRVAEQGDLDEAVREIEHKILQKSAAAVREGLRAFAAREDLALGDAVAMLRQRFAEMLATDDAREGLQAFLEKRAPHWTGR